MNGPGTDQELIVQISDPHIGYSAEIRDPERALAAAVEQVLAIEPQPVAVILSGDLTNSGAPEQYRRLRELIEPLPMPVHPMMGNHDDRDALREAFSDHPEVAATEGPVQYSVRCGGMRVVACDSFASADTDAGALGPERLAWIERELGSGAGIPTILAIHHAPIATGIAGFDLIGLPEEDRRALARILTRAEGIERVVTGHIHRTIFSEVGGVPVVVCPSVFLQAGLDLSGREAIELIGEPPALAVHVHRRGKRLLTHIHPVPQPE
jgi:Icc protein